MNGSDIRQNLKTLFWGHFWVLLTRQDFSSEKRALSLFLLYDFLMSCKKSEDNNEPIVRS